MFDRYQGGERALLVHIDFSDCGSAVSKQEEDPDEFVELVGSTGTTCLSLIKGKRSSPDPRYFMGSGKVAEVAEQVKLLEADVVIFDHSLSPSQERNLEQSLRCRVLDRTTLILDIFAQRARSFEGRLQVELAQLQHLSTRLVRGWTHLERQKGGIGLRGPGEKQLETDRRLLAERIRTIRKRLDKVASQRNQGRQARQKAEIPTVSLVGYTNAGKSSLFNALCQAGVYAADQLFATLDPTLRRLDMPYNQAIILADTVGFIRHLPHDLVAAFRATLQETADADLLMHVVDASDPKRDLYIEQVNQVLKDLGADDKPQLFVYNKIDLTDSAPQIKQGVEGEPPSVWVSAKTGAGLAELKMALEQFFASDIVRGNLHLPMSAGRVRAELFEQGAVLDEKITDAGEWVLDICLNKRDYNRLVKRYSELKVLQ